MRLTSPIPDIVSFELKIKKIVEDCYPEDQYSKKRINYIVSFLLILSLPASYIHLVFVSRKNNFYVNLVESNLTESVAKAVGGVHKTNRYSKIFGKFYLFPLKIYSHMVREEWVFKSSAMKNVLSSIAEKYIKFFITKMKYKRFYIREDFFGEASLICSINQAIGSFHTISYQHGSMSLSKIKQIGIYPGQRANIQISYDIATYDLFVRNNPFRSKIILSKPCFGSVNKMHLKHDEIYFIGNASFEVYRELDSIAASIRKKFSFVKLYYKPHPSEKMIGSINMEKCRFLDNSLLFEPIKRIFIGSTSTLLYDAYMSGHLVYCLDQGRFPCLDSLAFLGPIPKITPFNACQILSSIRENVFLENGFKSYKDALDYDNVAKIILNLAPVAVR